jgi:double-stranded uracil-DNA glycosylase
MSRVHCFAPIEDIAATLLILGSMPGKASLAAGEYYAHPRNVFWTVMGELIGPHPDLPYEDRLKILRSSGIALWDVLGSCVRKSSLDSHIEVSSAAPNDFKSFFLQHPNITRVFFNGGIVTRLRL